MAESSLSIGLSELQQAVGFFLGYGRGVSVAWSATQLSEINGIVQSGVRRVYYPPALNQNVNGYEWSWLRPAATLTTAIGDGDYDLPDDFGRLIDVINYPVAEYRNSISIVSAGKLLALRANSDVTGAPYYAAIRYKESTGAAGQRQEILLFPTPDTVWILPYEYEAYSGALSDSYPYPLGGMQLAELYLESCLALAESRINDEIGQHTQQFQALLIDAVARDRKRGAQYYGRMGQPEEDTGLEFHRGWTGEVYPITYKGDVI